MVYRILLICNYFSHGTTGLFVLKNLQSLGHSVFLWDARLFPSPPEGEFDISLTWTNNTVDVSKIKAKKKVLYYLEDSQYFKGTREGKGLEELIPHYDYFFTMNCLPGYEAMWLPMGTDNEIHFKLPEINDILPVIFIGTARDDNRIQFAKALQESLAQRNIPLVLMGNGWKDLNNILPKACYYEDFNTVVNQFKIVVNLHVGNESPSDKVHCIAGCGNALLLNDNKPAYRDCYPTAPVWDTIHDLMEKIIHYIEHEDERIKLVNEMQQTAYSKFSYLVQLEKLIKIIQEE